MSADTLIHIANSLSAAGRLTEAVALGEALVADHPNNFSAWFVLGATHAKAKFPLQAGECFERAVAIAPNDISAWCALGEARLQAGQTTEAADALRRAMELDPKAEHPAGCRARALVARTLSALRKSAQA